MSASPFDEPPPRLEPVANRKRRRRLILFSIGAVTLLAAQLVVYTPLLFYSSPFATTGLVLGCDGTPSIRYGFEPVFPPFSRVTVYWAVNGSAQILLTFYVERLTVSQTGQSTTWSVHPIASWNGSSGSGTFAGDGGSVFFQGYYHPATPFGSCPDYRLLVNGFYIPWADYAPPVGSGLGS